MFQVRPARDQRDLHIGDGTARQHAQVGLFHQVGQYQPLPAAVQVVLGHGGGKMQPAAPLPGLQQQVHLGIMPQGLIVPHALHRPGDGLAVENAALAEGHGQLEAVMQHALQYFQLHLAHQLHPDLPLFAVPQHVQLGILLLQDAQLLQGAAGIIAQGQQHLIGENRRQQRGVGGGLRPQAVPGPGNGEPGDGAHRARGRFLGQFEFLPAVQADLVDLFAALQQGFDPQAAPRHLDPGEARALGIPADLIHPGSEGPGIGGSGHIAQQGIQQGVHAFIFEGAAKQAGKEPAFFCELPYLGQGNIAGLQQAFHGGLAAQGEVVQGVGSVDIHAGVAEAGAQVMRQLRPVRAGLVHLVDEEQRGHIIGLQQPPQGQGMALHAVRAADHQHRAVDHPQGALHLAGKIHVARGIQQGDFHPLPGQHGLLGKNGDAPFPLLGVGIQKRVPVIHPAQLAQLARGVQHGLRKRGFSRVHVGQQADIQHPRVLLRSDGDSIA